MKYHCKTRPDTFDPTISEKLCPGQYFLKARNTTDFDKNYHHYLGFKSSFLDELNKTTGLHVSHTGKVAEGHQIVLDAEMLERKFVSHIPLNFSAVTKVVQIGEVGCAD